jgi:hypothetical protein
MSIQSIRSNQSNNRSTFNRKGSASFQTNFNRGLDQRKIIFDSGNQIEWLIARRKLRRKFIAENCWDRIQSPNLIPESTPDFTFDQLYQIELYRSTIDKKKPSTRGQTEEDIDKANELMELDCKLKAKEKYDTLIERKYKLQDRIDEKNGKCLKIFTTHLGPTALSIIQDQLDSNNFSEAWRELNLNLLSGIDANASYIRRYMNEIKYNYKDSLKKFIGDMFDIFAVLDFTEKIDHNETSNIDDDSTIINENDNDGSEALKTVYRIDSNNCNS